MSDEDFAAVGRLVACFSVVEHSLGKLLLWESMEDQLGEAEKSAEGELVLDVTSIRNTLGNRADGFLRQTQNKVWEEHKSRILEPLAKRIKDLVDVRNEVCHGLWSSSGDRLFVTFFSHKKIQAKSTECSTTYTRSEMHELADELLCIDKVIHQEVLRFL